MIHIKTPKSPFQKIHKRNLKKFSKKELIAKAMADLDINALLTNKCERLERLIEQKESHMQIAEKEIIRKDEIIKHKDKLLLSLIQS